MLRKIITYPIRALGIKSEGLRVIKILANPERVPKSKREKDIMAIEELLVHIKQSDYHMNKMKEIYSHLTKKQIAIVKKVTEENFIELFECSKENDVVFYKEDKSNEEIAKECNIPISEVNEILE